MEKFSVATIAHVTGFTVSTVTSWAAKQNKTTKDGLTVPEIMDFLSAPKHNNERSKVDELKAKRDYFLENFGKFFEEEKN